MFEASLIMAFVFFIWAGGFIMESVRELRQIKQAKLVRSIRNHPAGKAR